MWNRRFLEEQKGPSLNSEVQYQFPSGPQHRMPEWVEREIGDHNSKTLAAIAMLSACTHLTGSRSQYLQVLINVFKCLPHSEKDFLKTYFTLYSITLIHLVLQFSKPKLPKQFLHFRLSYQTFSMFFLYVCFFLCVLHAMPIIMKSINDEVLIERTNKM